MGKNVQNSLLVVTGRRSNQLSYHPKNRGKVNRRIRGTGVKIGFETPVPKAREGVGLIALGSASAGNVNGCVKFSPDFAA